MFGKGAEPETAMNCAKGRLRPLPVIRQQTRKLLEARADIGIKGLEGVTMAAGVHDPERKTILLKAAQRRSN